MMADPLFSPSGLRISIKEETYPLFSPSELGIAIKEETEQLHEPMMPEITIKNEPLSPPPQSILDQEYERCGAMCGAVPKVEAGSCMSSSALVERRTTEQTSVPTTQDATSRTAVVCGGGSSTASLHQLQTRFLDAVQRGNMGVVEHLLDVGDINVNGFDASDGQTALHRACCEGKLDIVKLLVRFGADVRLCNRDGWSALHLAVWSRKQEVVLYLLNALKSRPH